MTFRKCVSTRVDAFGGISAYHASENGVLYTMEGFRNLRSFSLFGQV